MTSEIRPMRKVMTSASFVRTRRCEKSFIRPFEPRRHSMTSAKSGELGAETGPSRRRSLDPDSVRVLVREAPAEREPEDLDVEADRPVLDVVEVVFDALGQARVPAPAVNLRPARDAAPHAVAEHVLRELLLEGAYELRPLGTRADERHVAHEDVHELRQLVDRGLA